MTPFVKSFRYLPHNERLSYNPYFPYVNICSIGRVMPYHSNMSFASFLYNIPYFYLDGE